MVKARSMQIEKRMLFPYISQKQYRSLYIYIFSRLLDVDLCTDFPSLMVIIVSNVVDLLHLSRAKMNPQIDGTHSFIPTLNE